MKSRDVGKQVLVFPHDLLKKCVKAFLLFILYSLRLLSVLVVSLLNLALILSAIADLASSIAIF